MRGSIDESDFKSYIFPLMFFKRISDVYPEEYALALDDSDGDHEFAGFAENLRVAFPDYNLWQDVRSRTQNIGTAIQTAFREIEKANPDTPYGDLRQRQLEQQGQAARPQARRSDQALLHQDAVQRPRRT